MDSVISISDWDEEIEDISLVFFIALRSLLLPLPIGVPLVRVCLPMLVGCFQVSHVCFTLFQIFPSLLEYFKLFLIIAADFLIFLHNSCQSLRNEEEFLSPR